MSHGSQLRDAIDFGRLIPFIGIYDVFSATLAARHFDALFVSGFGFAASHYGLPDIGFIAWPDIVNLVQRVRTVLPEHHLLVDIDDGYCDVDVACHVVSLLERAGASGVVLEDQRRPRKCGHFDGKQLLPLEEYVEKLERVLATRRELFVVARTDASDPAEVEERLTAYARAGADAVLADGLLSLETIRTLRPRVGKPFAFNQIAGGKSPACGISDLEDAGASIAIYSTPCLFAAQAAIEDAMTSLQHKDGNLREQPNSRVGVRECRTVLEANLARRDDWR